MAKCETCGKNAGFGMTICADCDQIRVAALDAKRVNTQPIENHKSRSDLMSTSAVSSPPVERESFLPAPVTGGVKVVPFSAAIASGLVAQVENIIRSHEAEGWKYVGVHQLQTFTSGSSGCFGLGATPPAPTTTQFIVFRR